MTRSETTIQRVSSLLVMRCAIPRQRPPAVTNVPQNIMSLLKLDSVRVRTKAPAVGVPMRVATATNMKTEPGKTLSIIIAG